MKHHTGRFWTPFLFLMIVFLFPVDGTSGFKESEDSCIQCHSDPQFMVTNKKLYDYFQEWAGSIHQQEDVGCTDCHGGNSNSHNKNIAHGGKGKSGTIQRSVYFRNIPKTCGECHSDIYSAYKKSDHYKRLSSQKSAKQGPNCVTCHGSLNAKALNVNTVKTTCVNCHNKMTGNHPDIPERAENLLNKFMSVNRFYRYVRVNSKYQETNDFLHRMDTEITALSTKWHTFDLDSFEKNTRETLKALKQKRKEIKAAKRKIK